MQEIFFKISVYIQQTANELKPEPQIVVESKNQNIV